MEQVVDEYHALHPDVTVELVPVVSGTDHQVWLTTRLAGGRAPNIVWHHFFWRNTEGIDTWVPLNEYLEGPNPYVAEGQPGSERWADLFPDFVMAQTRAGDDAWYQVSMDWVEAGLFLNNEVLANAGVEPDWNNWADFVADCRTLRDSGVEPFGVFMQISDWSNWM